MQTWWAIYLVPKTCRVGYKKASSLNKSFTLLTSKSEILHNYSNVATVNVLHSEFTESILKICFVEWRLLIQFPRCLKKESFNKKKRNLKEKLLRFALLS